MKNGEFENSESWVILSFAVSAFGYFVFSCQCLWMSQRFAAILLLALLPLAILSLAIFPFSYFLPCHFPFHFLLSD
jgi:hypothetical protein